MSGKSIKKGEIPDKMEKPKIVEHREKEAVYIEVLRQVYYRLAGKPIREDKLTTIRKCIEEAKDQLQNWKLGHKKEVLPSEELWALYYYLTGEWIRATIEETLREIIKALEKQRRLEKVRKGGF